MPLASRMMVAPYRQVRPLPWPLSWMFHAGFLQFANAISGLRVGPYNKANCEL